MNEEQPTYKLEREFVENVKAMVAEQAKGEFDKGDTWRVVLYQPNPKGGPDNKTIMLFDRRDGVHDRQSAIEYMKTFIAGGGDYKIEAFKE